MKRLTLSVLLVVTASVAVAAATAAQGGTLRVYDPTGQVKAELTISDVVRSSAVADRSIGGVPVVLVKLKKSGQQKFHLLTLGLARRGARLHRNLIFAMAIDGHVFSKPYIDYKENPGGIPGIGDMSISIPSFALAKKLAAEIRG